MSSPSSRTRKLFVTSWSRAALLIEHLSPLSSPPVLASTCMCFHMCFYVCVCVCVCVRVISISFSRSPSKCLSVSLLFSPPPPGCNISRGCGCVSSRLFVTCAYLISWKWLHRQPKRQELKGSRNFASRNFAVWSFAIGERPLNFRQYTPCTFAIGERLLNFRQYTPELSPIDECPLNFVLRIK